MAVTNDNASGHAKGVIQAADSGRRRMVIGTNVAVMSVLALAVAGVLQWGAFTYGKKFDWTVSGVNSLSEGTERLVENLETPVKLTSAYFKTDLEDDDQSKFRKAVKDLIDLYEATNRSKIEAHVFDPLHDHEEKEKLIVRLAGLQNFKEEAKPYREAIEQFEGQLIEEMLRIVQSELESVSTLSASAPEAEANMLAEVRIKLEDLIEDLNAGREDVTEAKSGSTPRYSSATQVMRTLYRNLADWLKRIGEFGKQQVSRHPEMTPGLHDFLSGAEGRYQELISKLETAQSNLPTTRLEFDEILDGLSGTGNALIVETPEEAKVLKFAEIWPPANPEMPTAGVHFKDRAFEGEREITSAILQLTQKKKTAVVFVRFGGPGLLSTAPPPIPGMAPPEGEPAYRMLKQRLEELNFDVYEWDLQAGTSLPEMDPAPDKKILVVFKPEEQNPFEQQKMPKPQWGKQQEKALKDAMGENGRAIFMGGYFMGAFGGAMPATYPYNDYLKENWGIEVDITALILEHLSPSPGKWAPSPGPLRQGPIDLTEFEVGSDNPIAKRLGSLHAVWPWSAPLVVSQTLPEGVHVDPLIVLPREEGLWGVKDLQAYQKQLSTGNVERASDDLLGPFTVAVAATKGENKIVVFGARDFIQDRYTRSMPMLTAQGISIRSLFPANLTLFFNSLHWLNDDPERMELGRPMNERTLTIDKDTDLRNVRILVYAVWPALALGCGLAAWYVRRR